jgi:RNA polymerase sigma-70 factor (ECF subfamily)
MTNPPDEAKEADKADEARLIERSARGDASAFAQLYQLYRDRVFGFALRMLGDYQTAEDVTHEAFLALIEHPERYRPQRGSLLTFLCGVARNHILLHWRRRGYQLEDHLEDEWDIAAPNHAAQNPLANFLGRERAATVNAAVADLPVLQREALVLREFQELSYGEIASVTSTSVDVIKMRLRRARQSLSSRLSAYLNSEKGPHELQRSTTKSRTCA